MSKEQQPNVKVSVVMCTYNGEHFLRQQMDSILAQDYPLYEIIVQDDQSCDDTWSILEVYKQKHPDLIKLHRNVERLGFNRNFHTAMLRATGDVVAISDQDDVWFSSKIRRQVEAIGCADVCYTDYYRDASYNLPLKQVVSPNGDLATLFFYNVIPGHSLLVRRAFIERAESWNEDFYYDWWFLLVAHLQGNGVVHVAEPLNWHRPHAASAIAQLKKKYKQRTTPQRPTWQPYLVGWKDLWRMHKLTTWQMFYTYIYEHSSATYHSSLHAMSKAMLSPLRWGQLCYLCWQQREALDPQSRGLKQSLRSFFYPAICAYGNTSFYFD